MQISEEIKMLRWDKGKNVYKVIFLFLILDGNLVHMNVFPCIYVLFWVRCVDWFMQYTFLILVKKSGLQKVAKAIYSSWYRHKHDNTDDFFRDLCSVVITCITSTVNQIIMLPTGYKIIACFYTNQSFYHTTNGYGILFRYLSPRSIHWYYQKHFSN